MLKLSGEVLSAAEERLVDFKRVRGIAEEVAELKGKGATFALVVGGGNVIRGREAEAAGLKRETADYIGMLATAINGLLLRDLFEECRLRVALFSCLPVQGLIPPYDRHQALKALEGGEVVLLAGGTGNPFFSTDTAAALRALELGCEVLLKGTKVEGVYESDPQRVPGTKKWDHLSYEEVLKRGLQVMDPSAVLLCKEHKLPIVVFNLFRQGNIRRVLEGEEVGTLVN